MYLKNPYRPDQELAKYFIRSLACKILFYKIPMSTSLFKMCFEILALLGPVTTGQIKFTPKSP